MSALYRKLWNDRLEALCDEYQAWCREQGLPHVDAHEQMLGKITEPQYQWLLDFCERWERDYDGQ